MNPALEQARVDAHRELAPGLYDLTLAAPVLAARALPGQFLMLRTAPGTDPLLRRPFSICRVTGDLVGVLYRVCGIGTTLMSAWRPGVTVSVLGPLGRPFEIPRHMQHAVLIGGGVGVAPLLHLCAHVHASLPGCAVTMFVGGRTAADVAWLPELLPAGCTPLCTTEDGSWGVAGMVTDVARRELRVASSAPGQGRRIYACGPGGMLREVVRLADGADIPCQVSLEAHMACGVGACLGCVVQGRGAGPGSPAYRRVCIEGPVFDAHEIEWDACS